MTTPTGGRARRSGDQTGVHAEIASSSSSTESRSLRTTIDNKLDQSTDLAERRKVWEASKESGPALKPGLVKLRDLRNGVAKELGHKDYFALQVGRLRNDDGRTRQDA